MSSDTESTEREGGSSAATRSYAGVRMKWIKTPLNKHTFTVGPIRRWVEKHTNGRTLNLFAGPTTLSVDSIRVDIREDMPADYYMDAYDFVCTYDGELFQTAILDPPYSYRKSMEMYDGAVMSNFNAVKNKLCGIIQPNARVITFGYHSVSMGQNRGFSVEEICLFSHGGAIHDTIATVERFSQPELFTQQPA